MTNVDANTSTAPMPPVLAMVLAAFRSLLIATGGVLAALHWDHSETYKWLIEAAAGVMIVGPAVWAMWNAGFKFYKLMAAAVQAGINLTISGQAVDSSGNPVSKFASDASPPKPVTVESATQIVANFAPPTASIAKS